MQADELIAGDEPEAKLDALRDCLQKAELAELRDGRGKLLIFTEHRDTLDYLERNLRDWGYSTCTIHGGLPPVERKRIQQLFHQERQICIATEAAGEGINLQFCHLMINYDLPWNPVRLEQRMGRIHRIGQEHRVRHLQLLRRRTRSRGSCSGACSKSSRRCAPTSAVASTTSIGQVLAHGGLDFERLLREALLEPERVISRASARSPRSTRRRSRPTRRRSGSRRRPSTST